MWTGMANSAGNWLSCVGTRGQDSSVTDLTWLDRIPRGRPALMIAEGLVPYLTEADVRRLLTSVVDAFPTGRIQFDTVPV